MDERVHHCRCGFAIDSDLNAAVNILGLGLQSLGLRKTIEAHAIQSWEQSQFFVPDHKNILHGLRIMDC
ncbi:MAG: hypothetical protein H5T33_00985 [Candidatus Methanosuratus sp.]|nr:hypothetical protein [Candidatus Methanosuratincola sp.]